jgi:(E)-4-hydroxy-3-methylbut-2-enyl-diphosphate synthase
MSLPLEAIKGGVDAVRINPGNIGSIEGIKAVVAACKAHHCPIRIGVNSGSLDKSIYQGKDVIAAEWLSSLPPLNT